MSGALDEASRSPDPNVCPFFRREVDGELLAPLDRPDGQHRCAAIGVPRPQSHRQQEMVCLGDAHLSCPRYLRGATVTPGEVRAGPVVPRATLAALLVLVLSAGISFGYVVQRGGIDLPTRNGTPGATPVAIVEGVTSDPLVRPPAVAGSPTPLASPSHTGAATPGPASLAPTATPGSTGTPSPAPTLAPTSKPTPRPTSDRYAVLKPCPDRRGCWIYTVRPGDNLYSIAHWFGVPLSTIYAWNPRYANGAHLRRGDEIRMPPPTR